MSMLTAMLYVQGTMSYVGHTISYVKKGTYDVVYDMNLRCHMYNTCDIVCISGPTIFPTVCIPCGILYRMYVIRCRRSTYNVVKTYNCRTYDVVGLFPE
jgi:hypothetical protein